MGCKHRRSNEKIYKSKRFPSATKDVNVAPEHSTSPKPMQYAGITSESSIIPEMNNRLPNLKVILVCATCFGLINSFHVSTMFENDRHFSHLSTLEREMTFRTEMGFYYSYYKTIIEADSFVAGLNTLMYDNRTEYPDIINTLQRFNLFPEIIIGGSYRLFVHIFSWFGIPLPKVCWHVSRGESLAPVISCEGIGDPAYWYLTGVWLSAGFSAALIFISGVQLSKSLIGGLISVLCFYFNHGEATRVQWAPPLRENFAFPFILAINIVVTYSLRKPKVSWIQPLLFGNLALSYLLCWQFAQFTLVIYIILLYSLYALGMIPALPMLLTLMGAIYALINCLLFQFGNNMLLASPLAGVLLGVLLLYVFIEPILQLLPHPSNIGGQLAFLVISCLASKIELSRMFSIDDDEHVLNLLKAKLSNYSDFHTKLYTCSKEFDFLPKETYHKLSETLLLPCVIVVAGMVVSDTLAHIKDNFMKREETGTKTSIWTGVDVAVIYNILLTGIYTVMAILIMRLKLFLTPQLCIIASLIASRRFFRVFTTKSVHLAILALTVSGMSIKGFRNVVEQRSIMGEYSDPNLEGLLTWINTETGPETVFAGPMPIMANVLLSTKNPIVNHPHYENAALRQRTKAVYSVFSRQTPKQVYETLLGLKANYIILGESWCWRKTRAGCGMVDLWDKEEPYNKHRPPLCPTLFHHSPSPFHKVFSNDEYVVLQVPSKYIEIPAPRVLSA